MPSPSGSASGAVMGASLSSSGSNLSLAQLEKLSANKGVVLRQTVRSNFRQFMIGCWLELEMAGPRRISDAGQGLEDGSALGADDGGMAILIHQLTELRSTRPTGEGCHQGVQDGSDRESRGVRGPGGDRERGALDEAIPTDGLEIRGNSRLH
jgi:hypothetical protein